MPATYYRYRAQGGGIQTAFARAWPTRSGAIPPWSGYQTLQDLERQIQQWYIDLVTSQRRLPASMNYLARTLARVQQNHAMTLSRGPVDPRRTGVRYGGYRFVAGPGGVQRQPIWSPTAWKIPVRRITSHYYQGWQVERVTSSIYVMFNPTREAYFIEYGIHRSPRRVRRPIRKLSLIRTLRWADSVGIGNYVWQEAFAPMRGRSVRTMRAAHLTHVMPQSPGVMPIL